MFKAPSADDRLARAGSSDPAAAGAGGRVLWIPKSITDQAALHVGGPVYFYHRAPRTFFAVRINPSVSEPKLRAVPAELLRPDVQTTTVESGQFVIQCRRSVLPSDVLVAEMVIRNNGEEALSVCVEALVDAVGSDGDGRLRSINAANGSVEIDSCVTIDGHPAIDVTCVASISRNPEIADVAQPVVPVMDAGLGSVMFEARSEPQSFVVDESVITEDGGSARRGVVRQILTIPSGAEVTTRAVLALHETMDRSRLSAKIATASKSVDRATHYWIGYLATCPELSCSNQLVERRFLRDWIDCRMSSSRSIRGANPYREIFVGTRRKRFSDAHVVVSQVRSDRWNQSSTFGTSALLNFLHYQRPDGALPTRIEFGRVPTFGTDCPDWSVFWLHFLVHPDRKQLRRVYHSLAEYARFVSRVADPDGSWLFDSELTDARDDTIFVAGSTPSRTKGVLNTINQYRLRQALASAASILGLSYDSEDWLEQATQIRIAFRTRMWNPETTTFCALDKESGDFVRVPDAESVLPFGTNLIEAAHLKGLRLLASGSVESDARERDDPGSFSFDGTTSTDGFQLSLVDALATAGDKYGDNDMIDLAASRLLRNLRGGAGSKGAAGLESGSRSFRRDALTDSFGAPSGTAVAALEPISLVDPVRVGIEVERGYATIIDPILRFVCGVRPHLDGITIRPLSFLVDDFEIDKIVVRNNHLGVWRRGELFGVKLDGEDIATAQIGESIELDIPL